MIIDVINIPTPGQVPRTCATAGTLSTRCLGGEKCHLCTHRSNLKLVFLGHFILLVYIILCYGHFIHALDMPGDAECVSGMSCDLAWHQAENMLQVEMKACVLSQVTSWTFMRLKLYCCDSLWPNCDQTVTIPDQLPVLQQFPSTFHELIGIHCLDFLRGKLRSQCIILPKN